MKAAIYTRYGPAEVISVKEVLKPVPGEKEVLVRIHASTVNRTDSGFRSAEYVISRLYSGIFRPKFGILGCEFAGIVEAVGPNVGMFRVGDRVFGYNDKHFGAHAEYICMDEAGAIAGMPALSFEEAAPLTEGAHYALNDIRAAGVISGQEVMVYGATGAIGSSAVQLLKHFGTRVTAVCGTPHLETVKGLGADVVVDYMRQDFTKTEQRFDFIFDAVGKSSFHACKQLLKPKGIYISTELGKHWENIYLALLTPMTGGKKLLFPIPTICKEDVVFLRDLAARGEYKPLIDRHYDLDQIVEAYRYVESGQKIGNVVLRIP